MARFGHRTREAKRRSIQRKPWWFEIYTDEKYDDLTPRDINEAGRSGFRGRAAMDEALRISRNEMTETTGGVTAT